MDGLKLEKRALPCNHSPPTLILQLKFKTKKTNDKCTYYFMGIHFDFEVLEKGRGLNPRHCTPRSNGD